jgi:hypothetical protein
MSEIAPYLMPAITIIINIVAVTWAFSSVKKDIAVLDTKVDNIGDKVEKIETNDLEHVHLKLDKITTSVIDLDKKLYAHLSNHQKYVSKDI